MFKIRPATPSDIPTILSLIHELAAYEKMTNEVDATEELLNTHLFGPDPVAEALIGQLDETPIAFALFFHNFSTFRARPCLYLEDLYVKPEHRSNGYGKQILTHLAQIAVERQCPRFEWSVLDWNEPAINFYKSLGAVPMEDWTIYRLEGNALDKLAASDI